MRCILLFITYCPQAVSLLPPEVIQQTVVLLYARYYCSAGIYTTVATKTTEASCTERTLGYHSLCVELNDLYGRSYICLLHFTSTFLLLII